MSEPATGPLHASAATWLGFALMCLGMFMAILDIQVVATACSRGGNSMNTAENTAGISMPPANP